VAPGFSTIVQDNVMVAVGKAVDLRLTTKIAGLTRRSPSAMVRRPQSLNLRPPQVVNVDLDSFWQRGGAAHDLKYGVGFRRTDALSATLWPGNVSRSRFRRTLGNWWRLGLIQFSGRVSTAASIRNNRHAIAVSISEVLDSGC